MTDIRLPRLLDENLQERIRLSPVKLSLQQRLAPLSTAEMILTDDAPEVAVRDMVELFDENGSAGIYQVKTIQTDVGRTRTVKLEHGFCTLQDSIIPAQGFMGSVRTTLETLLGFQNRLYWTVGDVETPEDLTIIFASEYTSLLSALELLMDMLPEGYALDFDQSQFPWLIHLRALPITPDCEGRLSRNLQSVRISMDGSRLCTRVYPFGAEVENVRINLVPLEGCDYLQSEGIESLGVISRTFENDLIFDVPTLQQAALMYLDRHGHPETVITVNALDLSAATGETLDAFRLGKLCRLAIPDRELTLEQRITAISKPDVYSAPGQMILTLSSRMKQQTESEELDEIVRQITTGKLLGGTVIEEIDNNRAYGSFNAPVVHTFEIKDWAAVLDVRISFKSDVGSSIRTVRIDSMHPKDEVWSGGSFSAMPYLRRDELGQIAVGSHWVAFHPSNGSSDDLCGVSSTITMTIIEKTTT